MVAGAEIHGAEQVLERRIGQDAGGLGVGSRHRRGMQELATGAIGKCRRAERNATSGGQIVRRDAEGRMVDLTGSFVDQRSLVGTAHVLREILDEYILV